MSNYEDGDDISVEQYVEKLKVRPTPFQRLDELGNLPPNWDSYGAPEIDKKCIDRARRFFDFMSIVPCSDGGVQVEVHGGGVDMEIEFKPNGRVSLGFEQVR